MSRDVWIQIVGTATSGLISWWITYRYYTKSLQTQRDEALAVLNRITAPTSASAAQSVGLLRQAQYDDRLRDLLVEYRKSGTPVPLLDTYSDLAKEEKADLLDSVLRLARGRPAKHNKYRS